MEALYSSCLEAMVSWRVSHQKRGGHYLKGDPARPNPHYTSTGLMVRMSDSDRVATFEQAMHDHIDQTRGTISISRRGDSPSGTRT